MQKIPYLYRALRQEEIKAGYLLITKEQGTDQTLPFPSLEESQEENHPELFKEGKTNKSIWQKNGLPKEGVSTTPYYERALHYAQKNKVIVRINKSLLRDYEIEEYRVADHLKDPEKQISRPEDDEIIVVYNNGKKLPKQIIVGIIRI